ncbi:PLP-dependent aminotransferase family protein [Liquorilactobacillus uvarum]|uniref:GntR family transcriptional regulator n=1 Tax=Liquorilactobacillus uvarum DSM 19971 TaxID=1423812 RepID=A0A0R1PW09_9LACO|nr:PLP-dependent aminotransferase family protein [Liquorilactobacillus uvarum]KRL34532.1 GntR family transcriptional regulator [Liquorilactobacillus uvarum DSM 19971]
MLWKLPDGDQAIYIKLINLITTGIENGELLPGDRLPVERDLAKKLKINRSTIQRAFSELVSRGILIRKLGSGTWINSGKWGVLTQGINWQRYMTTSRLGDPENFTTRLRKLQKQPDVINLSYSSISIPDLPLTFPSMTVNDLIVQENADDISGTIDLKQQLIMQLEPFLKQEISLSQILITSGAQQAFYLITQGLLSYGDAIAVESPSYFYQLSLFQAAGIRVFGAPLKEDGSLELDVLQQLYYKHHLRFLFVNPTGQNPTTCSMSLMERKKLVECCRQLNLPIVEDDSLGLSNAITKQRVSPLKRLDPSNVLYVGSLSSLSGTGTRIGWLIAPPAIVERLAEIRQQMESGISVLSQSVATQLLQQPQLSRLVQAQLHNLEKQKKYLLRALEPLVMQKAISYNLPTYGSNIWLQLNVGRKLTNADYNLFLDHRLLVLPDFLFGVQSNHVRLSFTHISAANELELEKRFKSVMDELV